VIDRQSIATLIGCSLGMLVGLGIDDYAGRVATLAALCASGSRSFPYWIHLHWTQLPAMHVGMLLGGVLPTAIARPVAIAPPSKHESSRPIAATIRIGWCITLMFIGMEAGALASRSLVSGSYAELAMLGGMVLGMALGSLIAACPHLPQLARARLASAADTLHSITRASRLIERLNAVPPAASRRRLTISSAAVTGRPFTATTMSPAANPIFWNAPRSDPGNSRITRGGVEAAAYTITGLTTPSQHGSQGSARSAGDPRMSTPATTTKNRSMRLIPSERDNVTI
jgi:hypothetical protein